MVFASSIVVSLIFTYYVESRREEDVGIIQQNNDVYTASWVVEIMEGGKYMADNIAHKHGFINLGQLKVRYILS